MSTSVLALPVSVEQVAAVIKQMTPVDQRHLLDLVPDFRHLASLSPSRTVEEAQTTVAQLRNKVVSTVNNQLLSPDEPFFGDLTLQQYHALSDEEKTKLWDRWTDMDMTNLDEREVQPDAVSAG